MPTPGRPRRLRIGTLWIDALGLTEALEEIEALVDAGAGGAVYTPNVDHVVRAESDPAFRRVYEDASLSLADGKPLVWLARRLGCPFSGRVAGSDLIMPLMELAARRRWRVYLIGGAPGVAAEAATLLADQLAVDVAGWDSPAIAPDGSDVSGDSVAMARSAKADIILVALGAPKQEFWIHRARPVLGPAVGIGVGGALDFLIGRHKRAPRWVADAGLEWLFRLVQEPRRLWRRYLVDDPRFALIAFATWWSRRR